MLFKKSLLIFCLTLLNFVVKAQTTDDSWKVYNDTVLARIDITVATAGLKFMYDNPSSDSEHVASIHFKNAWFDETVDSVGFRLRGNTSRDAGKKSFKVEFNSFIKGRTFHGVKDLNLNGEHNDPSIVRSKLTFDLLHKIGLISSRASHIQVYINGVYYGLYISVEQIDDEFLKKNYRDFSGNLWKCLYPADLKWLGSDTSLYRKLNNNGTPAYELKTNDDVQDFTKLVRLINIINNVSDAALPDSLEDVIAIQEVAKYLALHVEVGSWDSYWSMMNNYYLYHEPAKSILHIIPYDEDNAYGIDWFGVTWSSSNIYSWNKASSGSRPLAEKFMANKQYRNLYTHYMRLINEKVFKLNNWEGHIDTLKTLITDAAAADTYRTRDYGFTVDQFNNSYSASSFSNQHVKNGLKQYINLRYTATASQVANQTANPLVYNISLNTKSPLPTDSIRVTAYAYDESGLKSVVIKYTPANSGTPQLYPMQYSPVSNSLNPEDYDRYTGTIPPLGFQGSGTVSIVATDSTSVAQTYPRRSPFSVKAVSPSSHVVVNEFLADNTMNPDAAGEFDDWVELYNPTDDTVNLANKYMTDNASNLKKWRFGSASLPLAPGAFVVVWCDEQPAQGALHAGFKLSKSGEYIALVDTNGSTIIDSITFGPQNTNITYGRYPDGSTTWRYLYPTPGAPNFVTEVKEKLTVREFSLKQNYPNPFNPETVISYSLANSGSVSLKVYDIVGNEVGNLISGVQTAGEHSVRFSGHNLASGIYFAVLRTNSGMKCIKLQLLK
jgi:spore coat protein CotH